MSTNDGEEEFYYTELEVCVDTLTDSFPNISASSPPTLSHMDMARPPCEDPVYQKSLQVMQLFHLTSFILPQRD